MFERFTDRARRALTWAQEEARLLNHSFIGTEHLLLGLIHEREGVGVRALQSLGVSLEAVRGKVEETVGMSGTPPSGSPPFTPRAKKVLEPRSAKRCRWVDSYIGTEHLLLGLVREGEGVAATVLVTLGADLHRVRQEVLKLMSGGEVSPQTTSSSAPHEPCCPRCRAVVSDAACFRTISVPAENGDADPLSTDVVFCRQCGTTLHMFTSENPT